MSIKKVSRLIRFERRISMGLAAEYFSSLIDEEVSEGDFYKIAYGRIPTYMKPRNGKGIAAFAGFFEEELKTFLLDAGWESGQATEDSVRIDIPAGAWPTGLNYLEDELPYPLHWVFFEGPPTVASETSGEAVIYWMLWDSAKKEITSIQPYDSDLFELCVEPKAVHELAMQTLDDTYWPEPDSQCITSMEISRPNTLAGIALDTPLTQIFSAPVTAYQADDGFDNLFGPFEVESDSQAKPKRKDTYNWPLIAGGLLHLLIKDKKTNKSGVIGDLVELNAWGLGERTLNGALARAEEVLELKLKK